MNTQTRTWRDAYLAELEQAAATLPAERRSELLAQVRDHLDRELAANDDSEHAKAVVSRLGDPYDLVAEAIIDVPTPTAKPQSTASEIVAILLLGLGGFVLPLIAPLVGVLLMLTTPRWTRSQVRKTGLIVGVGFLALISLFVLALIGSGSSASLIALVVLIIVVAVGPIAAAYAATRPRPGQAPKS